MNSLEISTEKTHHVAVLDYSRMFYNKGKPGDCPEWSMICQTHYVAVLDFSSLERDQIACYI